MGPGYHHATRTVGHSLIELDQIKHRDVSEVGQLAE